MGLQESKVTKNIPKDAKLWRYMTLDKLINLLTTQKLFFTPVYSYKDSDPFEGTLPKVAFEAMREIFLKDRTDSLDMAIKLRDVFLTVNSGSQEELLKLEKLNEAIEKIESINKSIPIMTNRIYKSTLVNCWHQNEFESEAMWRLYSENNKGIAIQTTFQSLVDSIDDQRVFLSEVKYLNFHDENLKPSDCVVNGHLSPLLKRKSFEHEREVRLFFQPQNDRETLAAEDYKYEHHLVEVNVSTLISKIYISPYAQEPFISSVREVVKLLGIDEKNIITSNLLGVDQTMNWESY